MPPGLLVTVPGPDVVTVSVKNCWVNVAFTVVLALSVTTQALVPEQPPPLQPSKLEPTSARGVKVTRVPGAKAATQVTGQPMPAGALVRVPPPVPALVTVRLTVGTVNVAVTAVAAATVTAHVPVPEQPPPLQPENTLPAAGVAVKVTTAPAPNVCAHVVPQLIPTGEETTVPVPVPARLSVSGKDWEVSTRRWTVPSLPEP